MVLSKGQIYFVYLWDKLIISWSIKRLSIFCLETPWIQRYVRKWKERLLEDSTHRHMSTAGWDCSLLTLIKWQRYFCEGISLGKSVWKYGLKQELLEVPVIARSLLQQHFNDYRLFHKLWRKDQLLANDDLDLQRERERECSFLRQSIYSLKRKVIKVEQETII